jgi:hypothetical protein
MGRSTHFAASFKALKRTKRIGGSGIVVEH